jgi:hypothetical protein
MNRHRARPIRRPADSEAMQRSKERRWEHRERIQNLIERMELEYDKALLVLHPLGISVSAALYNQMIAAKVKIHSVSLLHWSWLAWIVGMSATLVSFRTSVRANRWALELHDRGERWETNYKARCYDLLTTICNWSSAVLLIIGVVLAALFLSK